MAVDRGGLQYTISVRDQFSKTFALFKKGARESKAAFADLQRTASAQRDNAKDFKQATQAVDEQTAALKRAAAETRRTNAIGAENARIQRTLSSEQAKLAKERLDAFRKANAETQRGLKAEEQAARAAANAQKQAFNERVKQLKAFADAQRAREREASKINAAAQRDAADNLKAEQQALKARVDAQNRAAKQAERLEQARQKDEARALADQQRALKAQTDAQRVREKEAAKISAAMQRDERAAQRKDVDFQAQQRINQGLKEEQIQRRQIGLLQQKARQQFAQGDILGGSKSLNQARELQKQLQNVNKAGNSLLFTFRRLVGILAVFTLARNVVQGFNDLVKAGIEFNDTVQAATISIAGLLVAVTDVRDQFGQSVKPADELGLAMKAAQDQVKKLRQDALRTVATFEQLLETFQIAVAPGFAAGLNLDEIRKLTVSISQAAAAIGVQQNQLAEEVRSLLSGTIQARTTRIATALGITNADIRRLKETGDLFDFLQKKFEGFALSAEKQARSTLDGLSTLIRGAVEELLGQAAKPLFDELIKLGNEFFDQILTIRDAEGNLKPNPDVVAGFQEIFDALKTGVDESAAAIKRIGFEGLKNSFQAAGTALVTAIRLAIGFAETLVFTLNKLVVIIRSVADFFGITVQAVGRLGAALGIVLGASVAWNATLGSVGLNFKNILAIILALIPGIDELRAKAQTLGPSFKAAAVALTQIGVLVSAVVVGFDLWLGSIFDVNLSLTETISLLSKGIVAQVRESIAGWKALGIVIADTVSGTSTVETAQKLKAIADDLRSKEEKFNREVGDIISKATQRSARGPGFNPAAGLDKKLKDATAAGKDFQGVISSANAEITAMASSMFELEQSIFTAGEEFKAAFNSKDLQGVGEKVQGIFSDTVVSNAEKLRKLRRAEEVTEKSISKIVKDQGISAERRAEIEKALNSDIRNRADTVGALNLNAAEGQLVSLLRDQKDLRAGIAEFEQQSLQLAFKKAAIVAVEASRDLNREAVLLQAQLQSESAITNVVEKRLGARRQAVVEAENELNLAKVEAAQAEDALQKQIDFLKQRLALRTGPDAPTAAERTAFERLLAALEQRKQLESDIADQKVRQLEIAKQEAALAESGILMQGLRRGFEQLINDLPTAFEAGVAIVKQSVEALSSFISQSIVSAFDPTEDTSLQERFARFLQGIANIILQQIIQLAIQSALQKALIDTESAATEVTAATTSAGITVGAAETAAAVQIAAAQTSAAIIGAAGFGFGFNRGGLVKGFNRGGKVSRANKAASLAHATAQGLAVGGVPRPANISPLDTVPAWLQPGEFVMRKAAVDQFGPRFFKALNQGDFAVPARGPSGAPAAQSAGMLSGGLVSDQQSRQALANGSRTDGATIVPAVVAGEKELDRMFAGGKSAARKFLNDNAGIIRSISRGN